jgi:hypothetical protein
MIKPKGYDEVQAAGSYEKLKVGGHILVIKKVEEGKTYAGKDKVTIYFDTDKSDIQPNFFTNAFKNDTRQGKKWPWNGHKDELVYTADGDPSGFLKGFHEAVERSNNGFKIVWDLEGANTHNYEKCFVGKLVGGVFQNEEFLDQSTGESKFSVKFKEWVTVEAVKQGIQPPKDKLLNPGSSSNNAPDIYEDLQIDTSDSEMPF